MAKTGVTFNIQKQLAKISENKKILDWTYLSDISNTNFAEIVAHLYPWQTERAKLLNPWSYLGNIIGDKIKNFVWEADTNYDINYDILVESILTRWELLLKYVMKDWAKTDIQSVRAETYWEDWWKEMIIRIYPVYDEESLYWNMSNYLYVQSYENWILKNQLYKANSLDNLSDLDQVSLDKVYELSHLKPVQTIKNLPRLVEKVSVSDRPMMDTIKSVIYSIDRKLAEAEKHFIEYSENFKTFQTIEMSKTAFSNTLNPRQDDNLQKSYNKYTCMWNKMFAANEKNQ